LPKDDPPDVTRFKAAAAKRLQAHRARARLGLRCHAWHADRGFRQTSSLPPVRKSERACHSQGSAAEDFVIRGRTILLERERIKRDTIRQRRLKHQLKAA